jgi:hypothetical protein
LDPSLSFPARDAFERMAAGEPIVSERQPRASMSMERLVGWSWTQPIARSLQAPDDGSVNSLSVPAFGHGGASSGRGVVGAAQGRWPRRGTADVSLDPSEQAHTGQRSTGLGSVSH